jgi:hypothetical protein
MGIPLVAEWVCTCPTRFVELQPATATAAANAQDSLKASRIEEILMHLMDRRWLDLLNLEAVLGDRLCP